MRPHAPKDFAVLLFGAALVVGGIAGMGLLPQTSFFVYGSMGVIGIGMLVMAGVSGPPSQSGRRTHRPRRHEGPWLPQIAGDLGIVFGLAGLASLAMWVLCLFLAVNGTFRDSSGIHMFLLVGVLGLGAGGLGYAWSTIDAPPED